MTMGVSSGTRKPPWRSSDGHSAAHKLATRPRLWLRVWWRNIKKGGGGLGGPREDTCSARWGGGAAVLCAVHLPWPEDDCKRSECLEASSTVGIRR